MITTEQNQALLIVGNQATHHLAWADYAAYCLTREQGLRKDAFRHLTTFLAEAESWTLDQQIEFVSFLFPFFETVEAADYGPFPQPLSERLVKPALLAWCARELQDARPFRWYGRYYRDRAYLLRALALDPSDDEARETLLGWWLYSLYYAVHHLPDGYIGNPADKLALGDLVREHIQQLTSPGKQAYWTDELESDLELVRNYVAWKESGHPNLMQWGAEQGKRVSYNGGTTYYYEK
jgi:hypothetical protein